MKSILFFLIFFSLISTTTVHSQIRYLYYLDKDLKTTDKKHSLYLGQGSIEDSLVKVEIYGNKNGHKIIVNAHFSDSTLQTFEGPFESFYTNGQTELEGNYLKGVESGLWVKYDTAGRTIDSSIYSSGSKLTSVVHEYNKNGSIYKSEIFDYTKNTYWISRMDSGKIKYEASFVGDEGIATYYKPTGIITDSVHSREIHAASFPGGEQALFTFLTNIMTKNMDDIIANDKQGTCILKFSIQPDGKVGNIEATTMANTLMAKILIKGLKDGPAWNPTILFGKPIEVIYTQPVEYHSNK